MEEEKQLDIVECCEALLLHSSSSPSASRQWQEGEQQLQAAVKAMGARRASPILLDFLRRPHLPDSVLDALSHSIAICCGSCSAPPSTLTFTFSPLLSVHIKEMDYIKGGLGWKVWGTALVLSWRLVSLQKMFEDKRVLELGSGCGLCGLLTAKLGAAEVVLTDCVPDIVANLCDNALLLPAKVCKPTENDGSAVYASHTVPSFDYAHEGQATKVSLNAYPAMVRVRLLDWLEDASESSTISPEEIEANHSFLPKLSADEKFDWVIGSDIIYNHYNIKSLVGVIKRRLWKQQGQGLFAAPVRENKELTLFLAELDLQGMDAHVEQCTEQEWETCMGLLGIEEGGTLHGVDHYAGGLVIVSVAHKPRKGQLWLRD